jgi:hypothetical protein
MKDMKFILSKYKLFFYILLFILTIFFLKSQNFFLNIYVILKNNLSDRMLSKYGDCNKQGYGFIKTVYLNNNIRHNIKIYNKEIFPSSEFFFYSSNKDKNDHYIILINYSVTDLKKLNTKFKIIYKNKQCYFLKINK